MKKIIVLPRSRDEKIQRKALGKYYRTLAIKNRNKAMILRCKKFTRVYYPTVCLGFVLIFWTVGLKKYFE